MRLSVLAFSAIIFAAPASSQTSPAEVSAVPDLLRRALSAPASTQLFAYDFEDRIESNDGSRVVRGHVDPSRKHGDRVTITYLEDQRKRPFDLKKADERYEKNATGDIFCDTRSREDVTDVVDKGEASGGRVFGFSPKPEPQAEDTIKELMARMSAEAVVDESSGALRSFSATLTKAHKLNMFGEVKSATFSAECATLPNGRAYTARTNLNALVSAMGSTHTQKTVQVISNVTPVG